MEQTNSTCAERIISSLTLILKNVLEDSGFI